MNKGYNGKYTFVNADEGKYLVKKGEKDGPKMVRVIIAGEDNTEWEEKDLASE